MPSVRVLRAGGRHQTASAGAWPAKSSRSRGLAVIAGIVLAAFGMAGPAAAAPDFQLTVSPKTVFLAPGGSVNLTIGATGIDGFSSPLTLTAMGLPTGVTAAFSPNPLVLPGTSTLTLTAGAGLVVDEFNVNIAATGGGITHFALNGVSVLDFDLKPVVVEPPPCQGAIQGRLTNSETGAPIANSFFKIGFFIGTTDANGEYGPFSWLPGDYQFWADKVPGYWPKLQPVTFVCNQTTRLDYALLPWHPATVFGKVLEGTPSPTDSTVVIPTTTPISGVEIGLEGSIPSNGAPSAADGSYTTNVLHLGLDNTALTNVRIFPIEATINGFWPRSSHYPSPIPIGALAPFENKQVDVALVRQCSGKISGTVTYGDSGLPAAGVNVKSSHAFADHNVVTAANGTYSIDKALLGYNNIPVDHSVSAFVSTGHPRAFYYFNSDPGKTHLDVCGAQRVVNLVLPPIPMGHIEGHVYDDNNVLVAGAPIGIDAFGCRPCLHTEATSDANGYYRISDVPVTSWPVRYFDQFRTPYWDSQSIVVNVTADQTTVHDVHIVRKKFANVTGTVRDAITGAPIEGAAIIESGALEEPAPVTASAANGSYLLGPIGLKGPDNSSRPTTIDYSADGYWQHEEALTVEKDKPPYTRNVDLIPVCRGVVVTGVVRSAVTGAPIPFALVATDQVDVVQADANGVYRFENVDVGSKNSPTELEITAQASNFESQTKTIEIFCGAKVAVGSAGTIVIEKVTEPAGDSTKFEFDGELGKFSLADGETHTTPGLFPGTYDVTETPVASWQLREVTCNDEPVELTEDGLVSIDVGPDQTVNCTFTNAQPGTIIIKKETHPDGDPTAFEFFGPEEDSFTLGDGQSHAIMGLAPGTHFVSEELTGPWEVEDVTCDDDDSGVDPEFAPAELTVELAAGETVTCTFTNRRVPTGTVIIKKETDPDGQLATFDFFGADQNFSLADGEEHEIADLPAGTYDISESVADGWAIDRVECDDDDSGADADFPETATINLAGDETVTCTFFNTKQAPETGTIIVEKTTEPANDPTEFSFSSQELGEFALADGGSQSFDDLTPGLYGLSEAALEGWTLGSATCTDGSTVDAVDLEAGETVTCTFHNMRDAATGTIIIAKTTDPVDSPASFDFDGDLGAFSLAGGGTHEAADVLVGSYSVTEATPSGWDLASATCTDGSEIDAISVSADETVTCTFHNIQRGELRIGKVGVGGSGAFDFTTVSAGAQDIDDLATGSTSAAQSVPPGDYVFTETAVDGWDVTGVACDDGLSTRPSSGNSSQRTTTFAIEAGESVTCTFTNTRRGTITVTKETAPVTDPQDFAFTTTGSGLSAFSLDTDAGDAALPPSRSFALVPGPYSVRETLPVVGWDFTLVACISSSGASTVPAPSTSSAAVNVTLAPGDLVTCTYRNTKRARFAVVKTVAGQPPSGSQAFDFEVRTGASPSSVGTTIGSGTATAANGGLVTIGTTNPAAPLLVPPGTYQFCEFILPGWGNPLGSASFVPGLALDSTTDNAFQCVDVTVGPGAIQTMTLDNQPPPGGQAKTIGFWKNWASCSASKGKQKPVLDETLAKISGGIPVGKIAVSTCPVAVDLLNKSTVADPLKVRDGKKMASDPAFNFAAQYVAFRLNIAAGARSGCEPANTASAAGQAILLAIAFDGQTHAKISKADAARLNEAATILDQYNNNTLAC